MSVPEARVGPLFKVKEILPPHPRLLVGAGGLMYPLVSSPTVQYLYLHNLSPLFASQWQNYSYFRSCDGVPTEEVKPSSAGNQFDYDRNQYEMEVSKESALSSAIASIDQSSRVVENDCRARMRSNLSSGLLPLLEGASGGSFDLNGRIVAVDEGDFPRLRYRAGVSDGGCWVACRHQMSVASTTFAKNYGADILFNHACVPSVRVLWFPTCRAGAKVAVRLRVSTQYEVLTLSADGNSNFYSFNPYLEPIAVNVFPVIRTFDNYWVCGAVQTRPVVRTVVDMTGATRTDCSSNGSGKYVYWKVIDLMVEVPPGRCVVVMVDPLDLYNRVERSNDGRHDWMKDESGGNKSASRWRSVRLVVGLDFADGLARPTV